MVDLANDVHLPSYILNFYSSATGLGALFADEFTRIFNASFFVSDAPHQSKLSTEEKDGGN